MEESPVGSSLNERFPFWDEDVTITRVVGQRHFVALLGSSRKEIEFSFCNKCGTPAIHRLFYEDRVIEICPGCFTEMMQGNG